MVYAGVFAELKNFRLLAAFIFINKRGCSLAFMRDGREKPGASWAVPDWPEITGFDA